jgi:hypothetical protein
MTTAKFRIIRATKNFMSRVEQNPQLDILDFKLNGWEVEATDAENQISYVGPYSTKKDAAEAMRGMKRSKHLWK